MAMPFLTEPEPPRGVPLDVLPGIRRIVARNPSVMTYLGTNTYLLDRKDGVTVLDPGPDDPTHVRDIIAAVGDRPIRDIVLTHTHRDHQGAVAGLKDATGAPVFAYKISGKRGFTPDAGLNDGDSVSGLRAVFTPGHAVDHLCFETHVDGTGKILFSGDHVMSWSSSIVSPPDGNMLDYYRSLERLLARDDVLYLPGHGPTLPEPRLLTADLLAHRKFRENTILVELQSRPWTVHELSSKLYAKTDPFLKVAAMRNVVAHLLKLHAEGIVEEIEPDPVELPPTDIRPPPGEVTDESSGQIATMRRDALRRFQLRPPITPQA
jgi:glyoxylase-like metal-dependent hydrolase (beta-lactamase superfamily II)